ncbi:Uu.00g021980.m01.CDS01 [Anthostomella pinea]|uniref:Uu.00g021980.m01.CDS01 n=1 Tax=Anthostomella pinea TaxID=933095 RepID=A0AAI8VZR1_9PEZI|nr:Uu.00g021980.m01.CDS01 [Anthostomella pinea]
MARESTCGWEVNVSIVENNGLNRRFVANNVATPLITPEKGGAIALSTQCLHTVIVLIVGQGDRKCALAWKFGQAYVLSGNGGPSQLSKTQNIDQVPMNNYPKIVALSQELHIGLVVAEPHDAVVDGIEGYFRSSDIPCFTPTKEAVNIRGFKVCAKGSWPGTVSPLPPFAPLTHTKPQDSIGLGLAPVRAQDVGQRRGNTVLQGIMIEQKFGDAQVCPPVVSNLVHAPGRVSGGLCRW